MKIKLALYVTLAALLQVSSVAHAETKAPSAVVGKAGSQLKAVTVLDGKAKVLLPEDFTRMTEAEIAKKYVAVNPQPKEVWFVDTGKSVVTLSFFLPRPDKELADQHVPRLAEMMKQQMADLKPVLTTKKVNGHTVSRLENVGKDVSGDGTTVYSILQLSSLDDRLLMTTFHVAAQLKDKYYSVGEAALNSLNY